MSNIKRTMVIANMIKRNDFRIIAEIGIWKCATIKNVFKECQVDQYWGIDPFSSLDEYYIQIKHDEAEWTKLYKYACRLSRWYSSLSIVRLKSEEAVELFPNKYFDLVFIDGDHSYEEVKRDIILWSPKVKRSGVLVGHDYNHRKHPGVKLAVDECFPEGVHRYKDKVWSSKKI